MIKSKALVIFLALGAMLWAGKPCAAQRITTFNDCIGSRHSGYRMGDTVIVGCDSAFVFNRQAFNNLLRYEKLARTTSGQIGEIARQYKAVSDLNDSLERMQDRYYNKLKVKFDQLSNRTLGFMDTTGQSLYRVSTTLANTTRELEVAKVDLAKATAELKQENSFWNWKYLKYGIGGAAIGVIVGILVKH